MEGGCLCGNIRYSITEKVISSGHCHCTLCRKASGAPFVTWTNIPSDGFNITKGNLKYYQATPKGKRGFCSDCGSQLVFQNLIDPSDFGVTTSSLDHPNAVQVNGHHYVQSQLV